MLEVRALSPSAELVSERVDGSSLVLLSGAAEPNQCRDRNSPIQRSVQVSVCMRLKKIEMIRPSLFYVRIGANQTDQVKG